MMDPPSMTPGPFQSAGVPPGLASCPNEFGHLSTKIFLAENVCYPVTCKHVPGTALSKPRLVQYRWEQC